MRRLIHVSTVFSGLSVPILRDNAIGFIGHATKKIKMKNISNDYLRRLVENATCFQFELACLCFLRNTRIGLHRFLTSRFHMISQYQQL